MRDPFRRLPTPVRLWAAAVLAALPLGFAWSAGTTYPFGTAYVTLASQAPIRAFLAGSAAAFGLCAVRARTAATRALARVGGASLVAGVALAAANGSSRIVLCLLVALALVVPLVLGRRRFGEAPARPVN